MSLRASLLNAALRWVEKPKLARVQEPIALRAGFERSARLFFRAPRGTQMQWQVLEAGARRVEALEIVPPSLMSDRVIFYVHGGAFICGSPRTHAPMIGRLTQEMSARAVLPQYRLAPDVPFPGALEDLRVAWDGLAETGVAADRIVMGGDSAGAALALSLLASLVAEKMPLPGRAFMLSPFTDLTFSGPSFTANAGADVLLPASRAAEMAEMYLAGHPPDDPRASPLFADFTGAGPVWITVGDTEILRDDARRLAERMRAQGVAVTLVERKNLPHVWPMFQNLLPEGRESLAALAQWVKRPAQGSPNES